MTSTTYITNSGLVTAVGIGTTTACAAMHAGIDGFAEIPYYDYCGCIVPVIGAPVPPIPWKRSAAARLHALLDAAVGEIAEQLDPDTRANLAMIVTTCESERNVVDERRAQSLTETAIAALGQGPPPRSVQVIRGGAPSSFRALAAARALLDGSPTMAVLVCCVDSLLDGRSLLWLSEGRPLKTTRRSDGIIPGEAAAALVLRASLGADRGRSLQLLGLGFATEPAAQDIEIPLRGDGLTEAVRAASSEAGVPIHELSLRLADGAGAELEAKEQVLALTRLLRTRIKDLPIWLNAETLGHVGGATGFIQLIRVLEAHRRGYLPGPLALATVGERRGERAATVVRAV